MAAVLRPSSRKALLSLPFASKTLIPNLQSPSIDGARKLIRNPLVQAHSYVSEVSRSACDDHILRLLRREIDFELQRGPNQTASQFYSYMIDGRPGEQWIMLKRKYGKEDIKIEVTMFDGSVPVTKTDLGIDGELHITFIVSIYKGRGGDVLEFLCSAWPDSIEIKQVFMRSPCDRMPAEPYKGPEFNDLDDNLQTAFYDFLALRGINDSLAVFLHAYIKSKEKTEFIRWMETVKSFVEMEYKKN